MHIVCENRLHGSLLYSWIISVVAQLKLFVDGQEKSQSSTSQVNAYQVLVTRYTATSARLCVRLYIALLRHMLLAAEHRRDADLAQQGVKENDTSAWLKWEAEFM